MITTFHISKSRTFVSGLFWQPLSGLGSDSRRETRQLAAELDFDLAIWRTSFPQVGMTSRAAGAKPGFMSAAAAVSTAVEAETGARDFLCATEVSEDLWLYVAQRDGIILPDGDATGSEDEIKMRLLQDISLGSWEQVYAPTHWGIENTTQERVFEDFLPQKGGKNEYKRWWELQALDRWSPGRFFKSKSVMVILCVAVALSWFGYREYRNWQAAKLAAQLAAAGQQPKLPHPWKTIPHAKAYLESCITAITEAGNLWPGNWTPKEGVCSGGAFNVEWTRGTYGWIEHLRAVQPKAAISADGAKATLSVPIKLPPGEDEIAPQEVERNFLMSGAAQKYGFIITLNPLPPPPPPPPPKDGEPPPPIQDWREIKWSVRPTELPPHVVVNALDGKGFRIDSIKSVFTNGRFTWSLEGTQYVQL